MKKFAPLGIAAVFALALGSFAVTPAQAGCGNCETDGHAHEADHTHAEPGTIVEIAAGNENFSTLVAAVTAADLAETLSGEGPFTVFAPTNEAFAALPDGTLDELLKPENKDQLIAILTYHVVAGKVTAEQVVELESAETVQGGEIAIAVSDDGVTLNETVNVVKTDIIGSNGVIHVIDAVLLPPTATAAAE